MDGNLISSISVDVSVVIEVVVVVVVTFSVELVVVVLVVVSWAAARTFMVIVSDFKVDLTELFSS